MEGGHFLSAVGTVELTTRGTTLPPLDAVLAKLVTTLKGHGLKEGKKTRLAHVCLLLANQVSPAIRFICSAFIYLDENFIAD